MNHIENRETFKKLRRLSGKRVLNRGDVNMAHTLLSQNWSIQDIASKIASGHGERWT